MRHSIRVSLVIAIACLVACLSDASVAAHEIGTTRVSVQFGIEGTYEVEIVTDATALVDKLEASSGGMLGGGESASTLQSLLERNDEMFRRRVLLRFDGGSSADREAVAVRPTLTYSVQPPADTAGAPVATIRLTGSVPEGVSQYTWAYGWTFSTYSLTVKGSPGEAGSTTWLEGGDMSAPLTIGVQAVRTGWIPTASRYLVLGFTHILPHGLDHLLFVLGIYLLSARVGDVLWQVSAFTVACSITLSLGVYGLVTVSPRAVEPLIAASITYVAIDNICLSRLRSWRVALVFAFGLLHGLGFAGALKEAGLPQSEFPLALVSFNVGVEAAQLAVIGLAFVLIGWQYRQRDWYRGRIVVPVSAVIACTAVYWTIERLTL